MPSSQQCVCAGGRQQRVQDVKGCSLAGAKVHSGTGQQRLTMFLQHLHACLRSASCNKAAVLKVNVMVARRGKGAHMAERIHDRIV